MELFFARSRTIEITRKRRVDGDHHDDDTLSDTYTNNSNGGYSSVGQTLTPLDVLPNGALTREGSEACA